MALARCTNHRPAGRTQRYVISVEPQGHSEAVICGREDCQRPAVIWLNEDERAAYARGVRIFGYSSATSKVRVA
jgi:hypothetical protein